MPLTESGVTVTQLVNFLKGSSGSEAISFDAIIQPKLLKKHRDTKEPCPFSDVLKVCKYNGFISFNYEGAVNRQREREGKIPDFETESNWHEPIKVNGKWTPLCRHRKTLKPYLRFKLQNAKSVYIRPDGHRIPLDEIQGYLPLRSNPKQGLDNEVVFLTVALENIRKIRMRGSVITLKD